MSDTCAVLILNFTTILTVGVMVCNHLWPVCLLCSVAEDICTRDPASCAWR